LPPYLDLLMLTIKANLTVKDSCMIMASPFNRKLFLLVLVSLRFFSVDNAKPESIKMLYFRARTIIKSDNHSKPIKIKTGTQQ